ncbi:MAG: diphthine--ammonia ligase [Cyclobacteriaceae bacterium]
MDSKKKVEKQNKISVSWSGGKDSSFMLWKLLSNPEYEVVELHTIINKDTERVGLHGIHKSLIQAQSRSLGIPLRLIEIEASSSNDKFEEASRSYYRQLKSKGITHVAFGDIFLEDLKAYRDSLLAECDVAGVYPLWKNDTQLSALEFIDAGFKSIVCSCDKAKFNQTITGRLYDKELIQSFPTNVDPCGENGEFHSFAFDGPIFKSPIQIEIGTIIEKSYNYKTSDGGAMESRYAFCDFRLLG